MDNMTLETACEDFITVVLCEPGKEAYVTTIANNLESLQKTVGGYIEAIYPFDDSVAIICNEEGKLNSMELNRALRDESGQIYDILAGPFFVAGLGDDDFTSLSEELQQKYYKMFKHPEIFFWDGNQIRVISL
jgi:hypothetical protein